MLKTVARIYLAVIATAVVLPVGLFISKSLLLALGTFDSGLASGLAAAFVIAGLLCFYNALFFRN